MEVDPDLYETIRVEGLKATLFKPKTKERLENNMNLYKMVSKGLEDQDMCDFGFGMMVYLNYDIYVTKDGCLYVED